MNEIENKIEPQKQVVTKYDFSASSMRFYLFFNLMLVALIFIWFGEGIFFVLTLSITLSMASYLQARRLNKTKLGFDTYVLIFWLLVGLIPAILVGVAIVKNQDIGIGGLFILFTPAIWFYALIAYVVTKFIATIAFSYTTYDKRTAVALSIVLLGIVGFFSYLSPHCSDDMACDKLWALRDPKKYCADYDRSYYSDYYFNDCIVLQAVLQERGEICNLVTNTLGYNLSASRDDWKQRCQRAVAYNTGKDKSSMRSFNFVPESFDDCEMLGFPISETEPKACEYYDRTIYQQKTQEGVEYGDILTGDGEIAEAGDVLTVHYVGKFKTDGQVFESSVDRGAPFVFTLGEGKVIRGWDEGLGGMRVGGKRILILTPEYAHGRHGTLTIPPDSTLIFEVELLDVEKGR